MKKSSSKSLDWTGKVVLVTGGTGSFGKEFTRIILKRFKVKKLIIFSRDEMKQYEMQKEVKDSRLRFFIGDIRDAERLHRAFMGVNIVVHAAALKIVPSAEYNPFEAVKTNVIGAENVINYAIDNRVERVVALSTDKAANPINLYGATKLCAEKMFVAGNNYSSAGTRLSVVRYGNVFGSRGSVVPFFKECRKTGVIPITDKRMTRFWITLSQGVELVINAFAEMSGGEIFVPKIPSIKITDLAKAICPNAKFKTIGIRPGEKLHETLVSADEGIMTGEFKNKFVIYPVIVKGYTRPRHGKPLGTDFKGYNSHTNDWWINQTDLKKLVDAH